MVLAFGGGEEAVETVDLQELIDWVCRIAGLMDDRSDVVVEASPIYSGPWYGCCLWWVLLVCDLGIA